MNQTKNLFKKVWFSIILINAAFFPPYFNLQADASDFRLIKTLDGISEYILESNKLRILLMEEKTAPVVTIEMAYLAGTRHETENNTNVAHLLEHIVMKATKKYNRENGNTIAQSLQRTGAFINATTEADKTIFYMTIPNDQVELALDIQADQMRNALISDADVQSEVKIVESELERIANSPTNLLQDRVWKTAFQKHSYRFLATTVWRSRVKKLTHRDARTFYDTYYWPNNAVLTIVGDFNTEQILNLIHQKFGAIPKSSHDIPAVSVQEPEQVKTRHVSIKTQDELEALVVAHRSPEGLNADIFPLEILSMILTSGRESRLYSHLVETQIASDVLSEVSKLHDPGLFLVYVSLTPGVKSRAAEEVIKRVYNDIKKNGIKEEELARAKKKLNAEFRFAHDGSFSIASQLNEALGVGDWTLFPSFLQKMNAVTLQDVKRAANSYLNPSQMTLGKLSPKKKIQPIRFRKKIDKVLESLAVTSQPGRVKMPEKKHLIPNPRISKPTGTALSERAQVANLHGIKVITLNTATSDVVSLEGSFEGAGKAFSKNPMLAELVVSLIGKETKKYSKSEIENLLADLGVNISFEVDHKRLRFHSNLLKEHIPDVLELIATMLQEPIFSLRELAKAKDRMAAGIQEQMYSPLHMGYLEFKRLIYMPGHPNQRPAYQEQLEKINEITLTDVRSFYATQYKFQNFVMVAVGDVRSEWIEGAVKNSFKKIRKKEMPVPYSGSVSIGEPYKKTVMVEGKNNIEIFMGHTVPINQQSKDYLALYLGNFVLGGDFSARLISKVREELGLTYQIHSQLTGMDNDLEGHWVVNLISDQGKLRQAVSETNKQIFSFTRNGITQKELEDKKSTLIGSFKVGLSTVQSLAHQILRYEELGFGLEYLNQFPLLVQKLTLEEVNQAIYSYFVPSKLTVVAAGDIKPEA